MFELHQVGKNTFYIANYTNIGIYRNADNSVYLIDTGLDDRTAEKILEIIDGQGWQVKAIINTHSNADHIGGNHVIQQRTGCPVFAYGMEVPFTRYPIIDPSFIYGGYPCRALRDKFFLAKGTMATDFSDPSFPKEMGVIPMPGHYFDMVGIRTPDDVVFAADSLCSQKTLERLGVTFIYDVAKYLETLKMLETLQAAMFVPAHDAPHEDLRELSILNQKKVHEIADVIKEKCQTPQSFEDVLQAVFSRYQLKMNFQKYVLIGSTVRSFLAWLKDRDELDVVFEDNRMFWTCV
ncbi:MAG: MBL fold metallo-hydrolase [Eubacteriales bacterium]